MADDVFYQLSNIDPTKLTPSVDPALLARIAAFIADHASKKLGPAPTKQAYSHSIIPLPDDHLANPVLWSNFQQEPRPHFQALQAELDDHFERTIDHALDSVPKPLSSAPRILSIGVGPAALDEYYAFLKYVSNRQNTLLGEYVGIDCNDQYLQTSRRFLSHNEDVRLITGDARNLDDFVDGTFDVVMLRHPEPETHKDGGSEIYGQIFKKVKERMGPNSRMVLTSFWEDGYNVLMSLLDQAGYAFHLYGENPHKGKEFPGHPDVNFDKYLIVVTK